MSDEQVRNADVDWGRFDPERYRLNNYAYVRAEDRRLMELAALGLRAAPAGCDVVDVGTGSNLYPLLAALPRAARLTAWEWGVANVTWLNETLAKPLEPVWQEFWQIARDVYGERDAGDTLLRDLGARINVVQGSIFDLPKAQWDASTMFFCAESITSDQKEFEAAMAAWSGAVRPGGILVGAFMEKSPGYDVGNVSFPALEIDAAHLRAAASLTLEDIQIERIPIYEQLRPDYEGMLFLSARAR